MEEVEVVVAHRKGATPRVDEVFSKVDSDQARTDVEVEAMTTAPLPTPEVLWRQPPALALAAVLGTALGRLGETSIACSTAWVAAGTALRELHEAPLPQWRPVVTLEEKAANLDNECTCLLGTTSSRLNSSGLPTPEQDLPSRPR